VVDDYELDKISDPDKKNYFKHYIMEHGLKIIQSKIKVWSEGYIPPFDNSGCEAPSRFGPPEINIRSNFHETGVEGDFILYIGIINDDSNTLAFADVCAIGKNYLQTKLIVKKMELIVLLQVMLYSMKTLFHIRTGKCMNKFQLLFMKLIMGCFLIQCCLISFLIILKMKHLCLRTIMEYSN
jgi:hypothetical protein